MIKKKPGLPAGLELQILQVLWERGASTVRDVLAHLNDGKDRAYTTILSTMQVMERKGLVRRNGTVSGAIVYDAAVDRDHVSGSALKEFVRSVFGGRPAAVVQHLLEADMIDEAELAEIRQMIESHRAGAAEPDSGKRALAKPRQRRRK